MLGVLLNLMSGYASCVSCTTVIRGTVSVFLLGNVPEVLSIWSCFPLCHVVSSSNNNNQIIIIMCVYYLIMNCTFFIIIVESFVSVVKIKADSHTCSSIPFHTAVIHMTVLQEMLSSGLIATKIYQ
jgi:hypothetical protein